jgi:uncharacterized protein (DUF58 family)
MARARKLASGSVTGAGKAWGRRFRRVADLWPLTLLGLLVVAAAGAALKWLAYARLDLVQLVVGYGALGLGALAVLAVLIGATALKVATRGRGASEVHELETGRAKPTGFSLAALRWLPLLQVRWEWELAGREVRVEHPRRHGRLHEEVTLFERGEVPGLVRRIVVQDAFGLARLGIRQRDATPLRVLPNTGALGRMPVLRSFAGGDEQPHPMGLEDGDRVELRRYVPGDPARFIHWKVFGRTRKLVVRMPERALSRARRVVAYLVAGPDDDASAGAARVAVETGALGGDWVFSAEPSEADARTTHEALELIVRSVEGRETGARGLTSFLERAERGGPATVVVFVPPRPGDWLGRVVSVARARRGRMRAVIAVDALASGQAPPWWRRMLVRADPTTGVPLPEVDTVLRALAGAGCEVVLVDRPSGRLLGDSHRAAVAAAAGGGHGGGRAPKNGKRHAA